MSKTDNKNSGKLTMTIWEFLKRSFWAGIATVFPLFITVYVIILIFRFADNSMGKYVNLFLMNRYGIAIPGIGLIVLLLILIIAGLISRIFIGRWLALIIDKIFKKTPLIANIYPSAKQLSDFLFRSEKKEKFQKVVSVEFPQKETYSIGFITNEHVQEFDLAGQGDLVAVFVPLAPTPVTGFIILMSKSKVKELDMPIDKALRFIVSGGVVLSDEQEKVKRKDSGEEKDRNEHD